MITKAGYFTADRCPSDFIGLSTDTKPVDVVNASTFYEMDTKKIFLFDEQNKLWLEQ